MGGDGWPRAYAATWHSAAESSISSDQRSGTSKLLRWLMTAADPAAWLPAPTKTGTITSRDGACPRQRYRPGCQNRYFPIDPLIVDGSTEAKSALERTFSPRLGFLEEFPAELLPETARGLFSDGINPSSSELA
jgi:hypothetical protein